MGCTGPGKGAEKNCLPDKSHTHDFVREGNSISHAGRHYLTEVTDKGVTDKYIML